MTRRLCHLVPTLALVLLGPACSADSPAAALRAPAHFRITSQVVNADVEPFTATIGGIGNALVDNGAGFEPVVFRNRLAALEDAADRVVVAPEMLSRYESLREGFYDDAEVRIYRIENGRLRMVRADRVAPGGSHASGWTRAIAAEQLIAPGTTRFEFRWDDWARPGAPSHFTVRAVDRRGRLSAPAPAVAVLSPAKPRYAATRNALVDFKAATPPLAGAFGPAAPRRLAGRVDADGLLTLEWDPVAAPDLAGYAVFRSDDAPAAQRGYFLQLAGRAVSPAQHVKAGDMVIVSRKLYAPSRNRLLSNRVWGAATEYNLILPGLLGFFPDEAPDKSWELVAHPAATPVVEPGETFLRLKLGAGAREALTIYNHSGSGQFWYPVLEKTTYRVEVWLRQQGNGSARFRLTGFHEAGPQRIEPVALEVGPGWKKHVAFFTPNVVQSGSRPNAMALEFSGPATFDIDNFRVFRADTPHLDLSAREIETIRASGVKALRTHATIKTGLRTYDMAQYTNPGGVINGTLKLNTLPQTLRNMRSAGVQPWLQVEYHMSPDEWLGLVEYLAAPYDPAVDTPARKPWAWKRYSQGQAKPWTEEFERIHFELSNETWNGLFRPWTFDAMPDAATGKLQSPGRVYGLYQEYVRSVLRSSPYWAPAGLDQRLVFVLGGWGGQVGYSRDAAAASPSSDYLTFADYNGGWDAAEGPPKADVTGFFNTLAHVSQATIPGADREVRGLAELNVGRAKKLRAGTYEAGPGYALNGLNGAGVSDEQGRQQEQVMKSLAAGTATLDSFLARAYRGYAIQNFFTLDSGTLWKSHAPWYLGGQAYPSWKAIALFNTEASGDMLRTETLAVPTTALRGFSRRESLAKAPLAAVYATRKGSRLHVFVLSRKLPDHPLSGDDGYTPVTLELPIVAAKAVTLYRMQSAPQDNNLLSDNVRIERVDLPPARAGRRFAVDAETGADARGLPPAASFLYVFEGIETDAR